MEQREEEKKKKNLNDWINDGWNKYQTARNAKKAYDAIKAARAAATAARAGSAVVAAESNPVGWIITAVLILILLFVVLVIILSGGGGGTTPGEGAIPDIPPISSTTASCPVSGGKIVTASYQVDPIYGHCGSKYGSCNPNSRRAKSIDVSATGKDVVLPTIGGASINWKFLSTFGLGDNDCGDKNYSLPVGQRCGFGHVFSSDAGWWLHLLHMEPPSFIAGNFYTSGTVVGRVTGTHVHITIGKNISDPTGMSQLDPGWIPADKDAGICVDRNNAASNTCTQQYEGTGPCSPESLLPYFGNDPTRALIASLICQAESGSNVFALNTNCKTNDYSVGLFQINAVAHCAGAFGNLSCNNLLSASKRDACVASWQTPEGNIAQAKRISGDGSSWTAWGTWLGSGRMPPVRDILNKCGIKY